MKPDPAPGPKMIDLSALSAWPDNPPIDPGDAAQQLADYIGLGIRPRLAS